MLVNAEDRFTQRRKEAEAQRSGRIKDALTSFVANHPHIREAVTKLVDDEISRRNTR